MDNVQQLLQLLYDRYHQLPLLLLLLYMIAIIIHSDNDRDKRSVAMEALWGDFSFIEKANGIKYLYA
jgi:hypothetical protein